MIVDDAAFNEKETERYFTKRRVEVGGAEAQKTARSHLKNTK